MAYWGCGDTRLLKILRLLILGKQKKKFQKLKKLKEGDIKDKYPQDWLKTEQKFFFFNEQVTD